MSQKYLVISRLLNNDSTNDIAAEEGLSHAKVLRWKRELDIAKANGTVADLMDMDQEVLDSVLNSIAETAPEALKGEVLEATKNVAKSVDAAVVFQQELLSTASHMNTRVRSLTLSAENIGELSMLADVLCNLQNAFFNKSVTNVQINNNETQGASYADFLTDAPNNGG